MASSRVEKRNSPSPFGKQSLGPVSCTIAGLPVASDFADFHRAYEWMSLQRNLRILGVFCRLSHRDDKHHYLDHLPRVMGYVRQVAGRYLVFRPLLRLLDTLENRPVTYGYTF